MKNIIYFFILVLFLLIIGFVGSIILDNEAKLIQYLNENYTTSQVNMYFETKQKWQWFSYSIIPIFLLIKISIIASILYIGTFFYSKAKVTFKQLFNAVVKAEFVFLGVGVLKIVWFYFFQTNYTLEDLQYFYPLSALNIVGYKGLETWFIYPLQMLNLFELAYWLLLSYFIGKLAFTEKDKGKPMDLGFKIVASSYGSALLLWVVVVMFFTLNYS
ncbi:MAG: hypothetical protein KUL78_02275 [Flavobacterium sp.]|nr:hypothetical protein [Flavobacterium sp.]